jgi:hypothetical protein
MWGNPPRAAKNVWESVEGDPTHQLIVRQVGFCLIFGAFGPLHIVALDIVAVDVTPTGIILATQVVLVTR